MYATEQYSNVQYRTLASIFTRYSVMQYDGNSFCGDVVLDSFNMAYSDKDSIKDQKYEHKTSGIFIIKILNFKSDWRMCIF